MALEKRGYGRPRSLTTSAIRIPEILSKSTSWCLVLEPDEGVSTRISSLIKRPVAEIPVAVFLRNGISSVAVALVRTRYSTLRMENLKVLQVELRAITAHFPSISELSHLSRGGILCLSSDQRCVQDLLNCSVFATNPASI
ncbi:uncharacterized protein LOC119177390 [Rhipicephalus microplus]|uniref:uncharacterized protein LOC119177390 n=1 Tax=Rhipicephalus microplus TaxID=6941 RepID=UPI003F6C6C37